MDSDGKYSADPFPLLRAAKLGDVHALRRFIAAGEDLNTEDEDGYTPLHWLVCNDPYSENDAIVPDRFACLSALVAAGADVNRMGGGRDDDDEEPCTPLIDALFPYHYVSNSHNESLRKQCPAVVSMLLRAGADVRMATADGMTPLHMAAIWGMWYIIPMLLAAGAEVDAIMHIFLGSPSNTGLRGPKLPETPLDSALRSLHGQTSVQNRNRVFRMLIRAGARIPTQFDRAHAPYVDKVARAGGYTQYEKAHRTRLAAIFLPKFPSLPAEVVHHIVSIWADCGGH